MLHDLAAQDSDASLARRLRRYTQPDLLAPQEHRFNVPQIGRAAVFAFGVMLPRPREEVFQRQPIDPADRTIPYELPEADQEVAAVVVGRLAPVVQHPFQMLVDQLRQQQPGIGVGQGCGLLYGKRHIAGDEFTFKLSERGFRIFAVLAEGKSSPHFLNLDLGVVDPGPGVLAQLVLSKSHVKFGFVRENDC